MAENRTTTSLTFVESCGNVFADLGLDQANEFLAKAQIVARIDALITERGLTQVQAARLLGIDQPKISALLRGRLSGFSLERLIRFLNALDCDVNIHITAKPASQPRARLTVSVG